MLLLITFNPNHSGIVGFLGVRFGVLRELGGVKLPPVYKSLELCQKLKIWYKCIRMYIPENIRFNSKNPFLLLTEAFVCKNSIFTESNSMRVVLDMI